MTIKSLICTAAGAIGGFITYFVGGWTIDLQTLCLFMATDFITGLMVAAVFKKSNKTANGALNSKVSFKGICKKFMILLFVIIAHMLDAYLGVNFLRSGVIVGFIINELISIVENAGLMGITSPIIEEAVEILKKKVTDDEN